MTNSGNEHTVKAFDKDLGNLRGMVSEMGAHAEKAIEQALSALVHKDLELAKKVVEGDKRIDELERKIDRATVQILALRAPMADDLRDLVATLKISSVIERIGDHAKNIAKRTPLIEYNDQLEPSKLIPAMGEAVRELLDDAFTSFSKRDPDLAVSVNNRDKAVDDYYNSIFQKMIEHMVAENKDIGPGTHLLFVAKNLERIGDQATNVAEMVYFAVTGQEMPERERGDTPLAKL